MSNSKELIGEEAEKIERKIKKSGDKGIMGVRKERGIWVKEYTLWTKSQMAVLAYFSKYNNKPETYREIARAYGRSNYTDYKKACDKLVRKGYLERLEGGKYRVRKTAWEQVKRGIEIVQRSLPYFDYFLKILKKRGK